MTCIYCGHTFHMRMITKVAYIVFNEECFYLYKDWSRKKKYYKR